MSETLPPYFLEKMPTIFQKEDLDAFLLSCHSNGVSDISFQSEQPLYVKHLGRIKSASSDLLSAPAASSLIRALAGEDAVAILATGNDIDKKIVVPIPGQRRKTARFRLNITNGDSGNTTAPQATFRSIPEDPPSLEAQRVDKEIIEAFFARDGVTVVGGATGSGKTTLLAGMIVDSINRGDCFKMNTYESPIEYDYVKYNNPSVLIHQCEIGMGGHLKSFAAGVRNAMRRAPDRIIVGESRDAETMEATIEAANTGHWVGTTTHAGNVSKSIRRMISCFSGDDRSANLVVLVENLRLIVNQMLVPSTDGKRIALREYLRFDKKVQDAMIEKVSNPDEIPSVAATLVYSNGKSFVRSAEEALKDGRISKSVYENVLIGQGIVAKQEMSNAA